MFKIAEIDHCSSNPSSDPGSDPSSDPSSDPGSDPSSDPGSDPSSNPGSKFRYPLLLYIIFILCYRFTFK